MENDEMMCTKEIARLIAWLKAKGHSSEDIVQCIEYIATGLQKELSKQDSQE